MILQFITIIYLYNTFNYRETRRGLRGPTQPQAPRKQTAIYDYFKKTFERFSNGTVDRTTQRAVCKICKTSLKMSDSSPASLKKHLKSLHPVQFEEWEVKQAAAELLMLETKKRQAQKDDDKFKVPSIAKYLKATPYPINGPKQERFDIELAKLVVMCNLPFSLCDARWFKDFVAYLDPRMTVKSRFTIASKKVRILYNNVMEAVKIHLDKDLPKVKGVALTTDTWQSRANESFQSLTLHYIAEDFELRR